MVFQNYALYPHLNVFDNMAFGLRLRKTPKDEIQRRVREAADVLGLEDFLDRKPKNLSGGQRQRVAMGRAIVREPRRVPHGRAVVEPGREAPGADARGDLPDPGGFRNHHDLRDPRPGGSDDDGGPRRRDQAGAAPAGRHATGALRLAGELVRRGIHRVTVDEHGRSVDRARRRRRLGGLRWHPVADARRGRRRSDRAWLGSRERRSSSGSGPRTSRTPRSRAKRRTTGASARRWTFARRLGSEVLVHFERRGATGHDGGHARSSPETLGVHDTPEASGGRPPRSSRGWIREHDAQEGESIELVVDTARLHFFDPQPGLGIDDRDGDAAMNRKRWVVGVAIVAILALVAAACSTDSSSSGSDTGTGVVGPRPDRADRRCGGDVDQRRAAELRAGPQPVRRADRCHDAVRCRPATTSPRTSARRSRAASRRTSRSCRSPVSSQSFAGQGDLIPIEDFAGGLIDENFAPGAREVGTVDGTLYAVWFRAAQKSTVWYNTHVFDDAGVRAARHVGRACVDRRRRSRTRACRRTRSASTSAGRCRICSRTSTCARLGADMYDQLARHEIPWTDQSVKDALSTMADVLGNSDEIAGGTLGRAADRLQRLGRRRCSHDPPAGRDAVRGELRRPASSPARPKAKVGTGRRLLRLPVDRRIAARGHGRRRPRRPARRTRRGRQGAASSSSRRRRRRRSGPASGGYISPNKNVDISAYTDPVDQRAAQALVDAGDSVRYDLSDLQPTAFGATTGQGIWGILHGLRERSRATSTGPRSSWRRRRRHAYK